MSEHPNAVIARRSWEAVSNADLGALEELWSPNIVWHALSRRSPWAGNHVGREAVLDHLARVGESVEIFDARLDDILVSDGRFGMLVHVALGLGERKLEVDYHLLCRVEDGLIVEVWTGPLDPEGLATFWG